MCYNIGATSPRRRSESPLAADCWPASDLTEYGTKLGKRKGTSSWQCRGALPMRVKKSVRKLSLSGKLPKAGGVRGSLGVRLAPATEKRACSSYLGLTVMRACEDTEHFAQARS